MNICKFFLILLIVMGCAVNACRRTCVNTTFQFTMNDSFSPEREIIKVGDTITLITSHSTIFNDFIQNSPVDFSHAKIGCNIRVLKFFDTVSNNNVVGAINDFDIISVQGKAGSDNYVPAENKGFYFNEIKSDYILKLLFIPKIKGDFSIGVGNAVGISLDGNGCTRADIELDNINTNSHLFIYQNWRPGYLISDYEKTHMYCFSVN